MQWTPGAIVTGEAASRLRDIDPARPPLAPVGNSGAPLNWGLIPNVYEHNAKLQDAEWPRAVGKMLRSPATAIGIGAASDLCASATFHVTSPKDASEEPAEYIREALGLDGYHPRMSETWEDLLRRLLPAPLAYGFGVHELDLYEADGRIWLDSLLYREPPSIYRWWTDEKERLVAVEQRPNTLSMFGAQVGGSGQFGPIMPVNQLLTLHWNATGTNFAGIGMLRPVWAEWRDREKVAQLMVVGAQRFAIPTPRVSINIDKARTLGVQITDDAAWIQQEQQTAAAWAKRYASGADAYLIPPPWWDIDVFGANATNVYELARQIEYYDRVILTGYLAQFLVLGTDGGSYSLGQVHASIAQQRAQNILQWIVARFQSVIERLLIWNFGDSLPRAEYPKLTFEGIKASAWTEKVADVVSLISSGAITPDDKLEQTFRQGLDLPEAEGPRSVFDRTRTSPLATQAGQVARPPLRAPLVARPGATL